MARLGPNHKRCVACAKVHQRTYVDAYRMRKGVRVGIGSGNAFGPGEAHQAYRNGSGIYQRQRKSACERCGSTLLLLVHHVNEDRTDNRPANLETLCKSCHQAHHHRRDERGRYAREVP